MTPYSRCTTYPQPMALLSNPPTHYFQNRILTPFPSNPQPTDFQTLISQLTLTSYPPTPYFESLIFNPTPQFQNPTPYFQPSTPPFSPKHFPSPVEGRSPLLPRWDKHVGVIWRFVALTWRKRRREEKLSYQLSFSLTPTPYSSFPSPFPPSLLLSLIYPYHIASISSPYLGLRYLPFCLRHTQGRCTLEAWGRRGGEGACGAGVDATGRRVAGQAAGRVCRCGWSLGPCPGVRQNKNSGVTLFRAGSWGWAGC